MKEFLKKLQNKESLNFEESKAAFENMMSGLVKEEEIYDFLTLSSAKGETSDEIAGGVFVLRNKATKVNVTDNTIDTCGTGGDGKNTLNISTAAALLLSSFGVKVAKHGNKSVSSKCGSADVLDKLNININLNSKEVESSIENNNFGFMFAPGYHSAMKHVAPVRKKIGKRTIFNLIGPLSSPANVKKQVIGVFAKKWLLPFAKALINLNSHHAWIVHSEDGMDEISPFAVTNVIEMKNKTISEIKIDPKKIGIKYSNPDNLLGKDADYNAKKIIDVFSGEKNEFSEAICLNSAAGLVISNKFSIFEEAYEFSKKHLETDKVLTHLKKIQSF